MGKGEELGVVAVRLKTFPEPPNSGHLGWETFQIVPHTEVSFIQRSLDTGGHCLEMLVYPSFRIDCLAIATVNSL